LIEKLKRFKLSREVRIFRIFKNVFSWLNKKF
jgi:hypothetical protein